jgi:hypothetical protein
MVARGPYRLSPTKKRTREMSVPPAIPCPNRDCVCTHTEGCVAGWIDWTDSTGKDWAKPCPRCRPEVADILRGATGPEGLNALRARLAATEPADTEAHHKALRDVAAVADEQAKARAKIRTTPRRGAF